ncbi:nuclear transport factor 2 family protein [Sphaerisporangium sp. TRM90804]|uniref:nuclear transport factor 2 family protein n=1 Tax=Sphaerisporangium sp. TRM90804 TaxID=3031113 RepID=UPI0024485D34|nr:nuclear transport factor 2 family protein [Sphaerisporangium sp. TRM90804]MDH2428347.1 nuclear transport factor 2 family protein [Sphaerisporangium sp. TRM90804]
MSDEKTLAVMNQFNDAFLKHDPSLLEELLADDCVLENSGPAPNGSRHVGKAACLEFWSGIASSEQSKFEPEEIWACGDRATIRWRLRWGPGDADSVRGVNLMRLRDGLIVEGMGYVKG